MNITLKHNGLERHARLFRRCVEERIAVNWADNGIEIALCVDPAIGKEESYSITLQNGAWQVTGSDELGLYYGIGKLLHSAKWSEKNFLPKATEGVVTPACPFRAAYFSVHFYIFYLL